MFGNRLKELRDRYNMTQSELAKRLNTTQQSIGRWEVGKTEPSIEVIKEIATIFNVSVDYLLGHSSPKDIEITNLIKSGSLTYNGNKISDHNLKVLTTVVKAFLEEEGNESNHN
ncbi:helix-turn-helix transcriptional regulator [Facklamia sp. P13064]|uniref:helix-turn-helix transcriptional regulator n=1 Tax=Facklamia sp. P13064 TaxID=3421953 RepID=UPI003D17D94A